jgi:hypothetical protein
VTGEAPRRRLRAVAAVCFTLLVVLLPALVAGVRLADPARPVERERIERAAAPAADARGAETELARWFVHVAARGQRAGASVDAGGVVGRARLLQVAGIGGIALLLYLNVLMARGRLVALLATGSLALVPAVGMDGHVLRPETPATLFVLLAVLLWQNAAAVRYVGRTRLPRTRGVALFACAALVVALGVATMPSLGESLLVPGFVLVLAWLQAVLRGLRYARRRHLARLPLLAVNRRVVPWLLGALLAPACAAMLLGWSLHGAVESVLVVRVSAQLLPTGGLEWIAWSLAAVGAAVVVFRLGRWLAGSGRPRADVVLMVYVAIVLATFVGGSLDEDPLSAAPALAVLLAEGAWALLVVVFGLLVARAPLVRPGHPAG